MVYSTKSSILGGWNCTT